MKYILLHGLGQTASSWNAVREALDVKPGVLCPELSEWLSGTSGSYRDLYREMERFCGQFDEPLALCGLSLGGMLALNYAAEHEAQVKALVLIGTQPSVPKTLLKIQNTAFRIMPAAAFGPMGFDKKTVLSLSRSMENLDFRNDLGQIFCRTLVVCGEKDRANRRAAIELRRQIPAARLSVIPNAGHEVNTENPAGLGRILNRFFAAQADFQGKIEEKERICRMNIRKAEKKDASRLAEILIFAKRTAYRPIFENDYVSFQEMQVLELALDFRDRPDALRGIYVYDDGIVKGMMHLEKGEDGIKKLELRELYIDPFFQGEGVGSCLMRAFLSIAEREKAEQVFLWVLEENKKARGFYERFGYRPSMERKVQPGTDKYLVKYEKTCYSSLIT